MTLAPDVVDAFLSYEWPGNVREMQNVIEGSIQLAPDNVICYELVSEYFVNKNVAKPADQEITNVAAIEKQMIIDCLVKYKYNKTEAAKALGMSRRTLYRRLAEYNIMD